MRTYSGLTLSLSIAAGVCLAGRAGALPITSNGTAQTSIVVTPNASELTKAQALELQSYLQKITGVVVPINYSGTATTPGILVGTYNIGGLNGNGDFPSISTLAARLPTDGNPTFKEAFTIWNAAGNQLYVIGKSDLAVPNAVARLLEELGCRWMTPAPEWEVIPTIANLSIDSKNITDRPATAGRYLFHPAGQETFDPSFASTLLAHAEAWHRHNRVQSHSFNANSINGSVAQIWDQIIAANRSWFDAGALVPPDNRYGLPTWGDPPGTASPNSFPTIEVSNAQVRDKATTWAINHLRNYRSRDLVSMEPSDGTNVVSKTTGALALGNGSLTDQVATLVNHVATKVNEQTDLAGKYVGFIAYGPKSTPPSIPMHANSWAQCDFVSPPVKPFKSWAQYLDTWKTKVPNIGVRHLYSFYYYERDILPGMGASDSVSLKNDLQLFGSRGAKTMSFELTDSWAPYGLNYYLMARLMWNPNLDVTAARNDILSRTFGAGYTHMRSFFDLMDPKGQDVLFSTSTLASMYVYLDAASLQTASDAKVQARLDQLKAYLHYNHLFWQLYRTTDGTVQRDLAKQILNLALRMRSSYVIHYTHVRNYFSVAAKAQFGDADPGRWDHTNPNAIWRSPSTPPLHGEIEGWFQAEKAFYKTQYTPQLTYSNNLVAVSFPGSYSATTLETGKQKTRFALYNVTAGANLTLTVTPGVSVRTTPDTELSLVNASGAVVQTRTLTPNGTAQSVSFAALPRGNYFLDVEDYQAMTHLTAPAATPFSMLLDKKDRIPWYNTSTFYFYVPKGSPYIMYYWDRDRRSVFGSGSTAVASPVVPYQIVDPDGVPVSFNGTTDRREFQQVLTIPTNGKHGRVWKIQGLDYGQLWFFNVPNYVSTSPTSLMVPEEVASADGLTLR